MISRQVRGSQLFPEDTDESAVEVLKQSYERYLQGIDNDWVSHGSKVEVLSHFSTLLFISGRSPLGFAQARATEIRW